MQVGGLFCNHCLSRIDLFEFKIIPVSTLCTYPELILAYFLPAAACEQDTLLRLGSHRGRQPGEGDGPDGKEKEKMNRE
jgi:hypothetical protein